MVGRQLAGNVHVRAVCVGSLVPIAHRVCHLAIILHSSNANRQLHRKAAAGLGWEEVLDERTKPLADQDGRTSVGVGEETRATQPRKPRRGKQQGILRTREKVVHLAAETHHPLSPWSGRGDGAERGRATPTWGHFLQQRDVGHSLTPSSRRCGRSNNTKQRGGEVRWMALH